MDQDPFHKLEVEKWNDLKDEFKLNWPRCITGYYALDYLERCIKLGQDYGFRVLNPFGEAKSGMVAVIKDEKKFIEMLIECPQEDTSRLAEALRGTKMIDWNRDISILFSQTNVVDCMKRIASDVNMELQYVNPTQLYILDKETNLYDVSLPQGFIFKNLTEDHIDIVNSTWPHRYPGSTTYFRLLIGSKFGYGLFNKDQLVAFGFVKEMGALGHLYTVEEHRKKGYGEMVTKLICNEVLKQGKDVFSYCVDGNVPSCKMHEKLGFTRSNDVHKTISLKPLRRN